MFKGNFVLDEKDETNEGPLIFSPWSLPWTYPTPHSPLSPEIASSSSGLPLSDPGVRAEFIQVVYKMVFWPCLCRQKQYYGCQMHFINQTPLQFPSIPNVFTNSVNGGCAGGTPEIHRHIPTMHLRFQDEETNFIKMLEDFKKTEDKISFVDFFGILTCLLANS